MGKRSSTTDRAHRDYLLTCPATTSYRKPVRFTVYPLERFIEERGRFVFVCFV